MQKYTWLKINPKAEKSSIDAVSKSSR